MIRWHHSLKGYEFEQTLGDSEGKHVIGIGIVIGKHDVL